MPEVILAVDVGTSTTVAAVSSGGDPRLLGVHGYPWVPSAIYLDPTRGLLTGVDAVRMARVNPSLFEPNPKLRIDEGELLLGAGTVPIRHALAALISPCLAEAMRQHGGRQPDLLVLTHPADWGRARCDVLRAAGNLLTSRVELIPEPVAGAARLRTIGAAKPHDSIAIYDLGAGTFDAAVVGPAHDGDHVLASSGLDVGGADLDEALLHLVLQRAQVTPEQLANLWNIGETEALRRLAHLRDDVRMSKEALSRLAHTDVPLPPPLRDVHLTRGELEEATRPLVASTVDALAKTIQDARVHNPAIFLIGGASRMPLCASLIGERLHCVPTVLEQPESTVALGAAQLYAPQPPRGNIGSTHQAPRRGTAQQTSRNRVAALAGVALAVTAAIVAAVVIRPFSDDAPPELSQDQAQQVVRFSIPPENAFAPNLGPFTTEEEEFLDEGFSESSSSVACTGSAQPPMRSEVNGRIAAARASYTESRMPTVTRYHNLLLVDVAYFRSEFRSEVLAELRDTVAQCIREGLPDLTNVSLASNLPTPDNREWIAFRAESNLLQDRTGVPVKITCIGERTGPIVARSCGTSSQSEIAADLLAIQGVDAVHDRIGAMNLDA